MIVEQAAAFIKHNGTISKKRLRNTIAGNVKILQVDGPGKSRRTRNRAAQLYRWRKAGIQSIRTNLKSLDSRLRGNDGGNPCLGDISETLFVVGESEEVQTTNQNGGTNNENARKNGYGSYAVYFFVAGGVYGFFRLRRP